MYLRSTVREAVAEHWPRKFLALMLYLPLSLTDAFRISSVYTFLERLTLTLEETEIYKSREKALNSLPEDVLS